MGNVQVIGNCSLCGGRVTVPMVWWGVVPPVPECESCGATQKASGPVIEMTPRRTQETTTGNQMVWRRNG